MIKIRRPVYEEVLVCEHCKREWYSCPEAAECCVCKKEGCKGCITWRGLNGKKYIFHDNEKCRKKLPKSVLKEWAGIDRMEENRQAAHDREYGMDHIC